MGVSYRQAKRLWKRYRAQGARGLVHGNVGRASNRAKPKSLRRRVLGLLRKKYGGEVGERFGPTLAAEHLAEEDGIELGVETLRGWMLAEGLWSRDRRRRAHRQRRERKAHFGELVQLDGSFHDLAGRAGAGGLPDEHGGRCDGDDAVPAGEGGDDLGGGGSAARPGSSATGCRRRCTRTGRMCMCGSRTRGSGCGARSR